MTAKRLPAADVVLLKHHLTALRLPTLKAECEQLARQCASENVDYLGFLLRLCERELAERQQRAESVLAEASSAKAAAEKLQAELGEQRAGIEHERHQVLEQAHARAEEEAATLLQRAQAKAEKLLAEERRNPWGGDDWRPTVGDCIRVILEEEWAHLRYVRRDLAKLG